MSVNDNGAGGAQIPDAELETDLNLKELDPESATPEEIAELQKTAKTLAAQKAHWRKNALDPVTGKKYRDIAAVPPVITPPATTEGGKESEDRLSRLEQSEEKRTFGYANSLSPDEVDNVFASATGLNITPAKALENSFVKAGLDAIRREKRIDGATPGSSHRSPTVEGKTWSDMKPEERKTHFGQAVQTLRKR